MASNSAVPPSVWRWVERMPCCSLVDGARTIAPAASPKSTQVFRSFQSVMRESISTPTTSTRLAAPFLTYWSPTPIPKSEPAHAASTSNAKALRAPSLACRKTAVAGIGMSGDTVPTMIASSSSGRVLAISSARTDALSAMSEVSSPSAAIRRSLIPVRSVIHSSVVSTIFSRSLLVRTLSGTYEPVPMMCVRPIVSVSRQGARLLIGNRLRRCAFSLFHGPRGKPRGRTVNRRPDAFCQTMLAGSQRRRQRAGDRARIRATVRDDAHSVRAEQRRTPVFGVVDDLLEAQERRLEEQRTEPLRKPRRVDGLLDHPHDPDRGAFGGFEHDVAGKPVRHHHVHHPREDVLALDVADESKIARTQERRGLTGELGSLGLLFPIGEKRHARARHPQHGANVRVAHHRPLRQMRRTAIDVGTRIQEDTPALLQRGKQCGDRRSLDAGQAAQD